MREQKERLTRAKAIRAKCLDCCCGQANEVRACPCTDCPLYRYRLGHEDGDGKITRQKKDNGENREQAQEIEVE